MYWLVYWLECTWLLRAESSAGLPSESDHRLNFAAEVEAALEVQAILNGLSRGLRTLNAVLTQCCAHSMLCILSAVLPPHTLLCTLKRG